jgi:hypothetical protein
MSMRKATHWLAVILVCTPLLFLTLAAGENSQAQAQGIWPWTSYRLVEEMDLAPLSPKDLEIMRNEIYARRGWIFARADLQGYFNSQPWYRPAGPPWDRERVNRMVEGSLSPVERQNISRISGYERFRRGGR